MRLLDAHGQRYPSGSGRARAASGSDAGRPTVRGVREAISRGNGCTSATCRAPDRSPSWFQISTTTCANRSGRETELFFDTIVHEDRGRWSFSRANYVLERTARAPLRDSNIKGTHFRRVTFDKDSVRGGLLGQGSILTVTSQPDRTSPVVRGKWILENFLGTSPPSSAAERARTEGQYRAGSGVVDARPHGGASRQPGAAPSCHAIMDRIGLSLENFDGVGKVRMLG